MCDLNNKLFANNKLRKMKELTVLMPVFNEPIAWLKLSILSVLNQTYRDFVFLIIDDGSRHEIAQFLDKIKTIDSRIVVLHNARNLGLISTLNKGIVFATTKWIARMDADDICHPQRFERQIGFIRNHEDIAVLAAEAVLMDSNERTAKDKVYSHDEIGSLLLFYNCITHPSVLMNREVILKIGGYPRVYAAEDYALWAKICYSSNYKIAKIPEVCLYYRRGNAKEKYKGKQYYSDLFVKKYILEKLDLFGFDKYLFAKYDDNLMDISSKEVDFVGESCRKLATKIEEKWGRNCQSCKVKLIKFYSKFIKYARSRGEVPLFKYLFLRAKLKALIFIYTGKI